MRLSLRRTAGFTLLEIMMVVAIIMLILGSGAYVMKAQFDKAKMSRVQVDLGAFRTAMLTYQPTTEQGLKALVEPPSPKPRGWVKSMDTLIVDPWNHPYNYKNPGVHNKPGVGPGYDLYSSGPDGIPDNADDIGNWDDGK